MKTLARAAALVIAAAATIPGRESVPERNAHDAPPSVDPRPRKGRRRKDWEQGQYRKRSRR